MAPRRPPVQRRRAGSAHGQWQAAARERARDRHRPSSPGRCATWVCSVVLLAQVARREHPTRTGKIDEAAILYLFIHSFIHSFIHLAETQPETQVRLLCMWPVLSRPDKKTTPPPPPPPHHSSRNMAVLQLFASPGSSWGMGLASTSMGSKGKKFREHSTCLGS